MAINMTFVDYVTPVPADWLNNVNAFVNGANSGPTANRPVTPGAIGLFYFDTTLGLPIWCSSVSPVVWVNAAGYSV